MLYHNPTCNITGEVTIQRVTTSDSGEEKIVSSITSSNLITKRTFNNLFTGSSVFSNSVSMRVGISNSTIEPTFNIIDLPEILAYGFNANDGPTYATIIPWSWNPLTHKITYNARFPSTGTQRVFRTVGLVTSSIPNNSVSVGTLAPVFAYLRLPSSVTQYYNESINVSYEITLSWDPTYTEIWTGFKDSWESFIIGQSSPPNFSQIQLLRGQFYTGDTTSVSPWPETNKGGGLTTSTNIDLYKYRYSGNLSSVAIGDMAMGLLYGVNSPYCAGFTKLTNSRRPLNNVFSHGVASLTPWYDGDNLATSSWKPVIRMDNNLAVVDETGLPSIVSIYVTFSGGIAVGEYRFHKQPFFGSNCFINSALGTRMSSNVIASLHKVSLRNFNERLIVPQGDNSLKVLTCYQNKVYSINVVEQTVSNTWVIVPTTPGIPTELNILGIASNPSGNLIYVTTDKGLYELSTSGNSVTELSTVPCQGVDCTPNGLNVVVWLNDGDGYVIFTPGSFSLSNRKLPTGGLTTTSAVCFRFRNDLVGISYRSNALSHSLNLSAVTTPCNHSVQVDDLGDNISYSISVGASRTQGIITPNTISNWKQLSPSGTTVVRSVHNGVIYALVTSSNASSHFVSLVSLPTSGISTSLVTEIAKFFDNGATLGNGYFSLAPVTSRKILVSYPKSTSLITTSQNTSDNNLPNWNCIRLQNDGVTYHSKNGDINSNQVPSTSNQLLSICGVTGLRELAGVVGPQGMGITSHYDLSDAQGFDGYGWNGSQWVLNSNSGKQLHSILDPLVDGISLRWDDLVPGSSQPLVNGQYYTQTIHDGFLFDGYQPTIPISYSVYLRKRNLYTFATGSIITGTIMSPISDTTFYRLDDDDLSVHQLFIGGSIFPAVLKLTGTPNLGEILLNAVTGSLTFNAGDVGKIIQGSIVYVNKLHPTET